MDDLDSLSEARLDPKGFIHGASKSFPSAIDECQLAPSLFPALKERVRLHPRPGQFLLSGSVRFTGMDSIKESLTGRITTFELLPFTLAELQGRKMPMDIKRALESETLESVFREVALPKQTLHSREREILRYLVQGGLPGVCFLRKELFRSKKMEQQLFTLLDRDLRMVTHTRIDFPLLRRLIATLAMSLGQSLDYTELRRSTQISVPSLKKILFGLQAIFILRRIPIEGGLRGDSYFFEDQGEWHHLFPQASLGQQLVQFCFTQFRTAFDYSLEAPTEAYQYKTRGGAEMPLAFRNAKGVLGVFPVVEQREVARAIASSNSFLKTYPKAKVLIVGMGRQIERRLIQPRIAVTPVAEWI
jgi:predicted AAA+ superfamily ATPase